jgi:hypothetical protein
VDIGMRNKLWSKLRQLVFGRWRAAIVVSALVVTLSAVVGSLLFFKPTTMAAGTTTATVYFNRNNPHSWGPYGDNGWMVWIDVTINGETRSVWGAADCTMPGVPYPIVKTYYGVSLSYTDTDASGNAYFEGRISSGTTSGQELKVYFTTAVEQPYQPVTKSQANPAVTQIDKTLSDDLTVYEADKNGNQVNSKFQWRKSGGKYVNVHVCVNVYGPFLKDQPRIPGLDVAGDGYFGTSSYTPPPTLDNSQVTIIGDEVSAAIGNQLPSTNIHTAAGRGFLDGLNVIIHRSVPRGGGSGV